MKGNALYAAKILRKGYYILDSMCFTWENMLYYICESNFINTKKKNRKEKRKDSNR